MWKLLNSFQIKSKTYSSLHEYIVYTYQKLCFQTDAHDTKHIVLVKTMRDCDHKMIQLSSITDEKKYSDFIMTHK